MSFRASVSESRNLDPSQTMSVWHHRVFQKQTQITLIALISQTGPDRLAESIGVICEISAICVRL
jgi:hypothetical protein